MKETLVFGLLGLFLVACVLRALFTVSSPPVVHTTPDTIRIAIIDTGYNPNWVAGDYPKLKLCPNGHYNFKDHTPTIGATIEHGTIVGSLIADGLQNVDYCAVIYQVYTYSLNDREVVAALTTAATAGIKFVNMSLVGKIPDPAERYALLRLEGLGVEIFVAGGNSNVDLSKTCNSYPSCYNLTHVYSIGATSDGITKAWYSNHGGPIHYAYLGDVVWKGNVKFGTSYASPRALSQHVRDWAAHRLMPIQSQTR